MALPRKEGQPATQSELAELLGVHPDSITDWKKRDDFWEKVDANRQHWVKEEVSDVVKGLKEAAKRRLGKSPDLADSLMLTYVAEEEKQEAVVVLG